MKRKSNSKKHYSEDASDDEETQQNGNSEEPKNKRGRKSKNAKKSSDNEENDASDAEDPLAASEEDAQYEVEKVLDEKTVKGQKQYLIRWKGYTEEEDTWEPESTLDCNDLIQEFKNNKKDKSSSKGSKKKEVKAKKNNTNDEEAEDDWNENDDFEVARILDVHFCRDGKREFLIHWKGYSTADNSWEPEDNLDCKDLIEKFMQKVEKARIADTKELRVNRKPVERLNFAMHEGKGRKLSKRHRGKERVTYFDTE